MNSMDGLIPSSMWSELSVPPVETQSSGKSQFSCADERMLESMLSPILDDSDYFAPATFSSKQARKLPRGASKAVTEKIDFNSLDRTCLNYQLTSRWSDGFELDSLTSSRRPHYSQTSEMNEEYLEDVAFQADIQDSLDHFDRFLAQAGAYSLSNVRPPSRATATIPQNTFSREYEFKPRGIVSSNILNPNAPEFTPSADMLNYMRSVSEPGPVVDSKQPLHLQGDAGFSMMLDEQLHSSPIKASPKIIDSPIFAGSPASAFTSGSPGSAYNGSGNYDSPGSSVRTKRVKPRSSGNNLGGMLSSQFDKRLSIDSSSSSTEDSSQLQQPRFNAFNDSERFGKNSDPVEIPSSTGGVGSRSSARRVKRTGFHAEPSFGSAEARRRNPSMNYRNASSLPGSPGSFGNSPGTGGFTKPPLEPPPKCIHYINPPADGSCTWCKGAAAKRAKAAVAAAAAAANGAKNSATANRNSGKPPPSHSANQMAAASTNHKPVNKPRVDSGAKSKAAEKSVKDILLSGKTKPSVVRLPPRSYSREEMIAFSISPVSTTLPKVAKDCEEGFNMLMNEFCDAVSFCTAPFPEYPSDVMQQRGISVSYLRSVTDAMQCIS